MKINELKKLIEKFNENIVYNADLKKKKIGLIIEEKQKFFLKQMI